MQRSFYVWQWQTMILPNMWLQSLGTWSLILPGEVSQILESSQDLQVSQQVNSLVNIGAAELMSLWMKGLALRQKSGWTIQIRSLVYSLCRSRAYSLGKYTSYCYAIFPSSTYFPVLGWIATNLLSIVHSDRKRRRNHPASEQRSISCGRDFNPYWHRTFMLDKNVSIQFYVRNRPNNPWQLLHMCQISEATLCSKLRCH